MQLSGHSKTLAKPRAPEPQRTPKQTPGNLKGTESLVFGIPNLHGASLERRAKLLTQILEPRSFLRRPETVFLLVPNSIPTNPGLARSSKFRSSTAREVPPPPPSAASEVFEGLGAEGFRVSGMGLRVTSKA